MTIDPNLAIIIAGAAAFLSAWLRDAGLSRWLNALIAGLAFVLSAVVTIALSTGFTGNFRDNILLFFAACASLAGKELFSLLGYLQEAKSPLAPDATR
jgi:hypothetical protein